jgi:hypothetical protein
MTRTMERRTATKRHAITIQAMFRVEGSGDGW